MLYHLIALCFISLQAQFIKWEIVTPYNDSCGLYIAVPGRSKGAKFGAPESNALHNEVTACRKEAFRISIEF
jgi:hypothetical protein